MGDLLGFPKGLIVNFVVRTMRKMVPAWSLPGHVKFNDAVSAGRGMTLVDPSGRLGTPKITFVEEVDVAKVDALYAVSAAYIPNKQTN